MYLKNKDEFVVHHFVIQLVGVCSQLSSLFDVYHHFNTFLIQTKVVSRLTSFNHI